MYQQNIHQQQWVGEAYWYSATNSVSPATDRNIITGNCGRQWLPSVRLGNRTVGRTQYTMVLRLTRLELTRRSTRQLITGTCPFATQKWCHRCRCRKLTCLNFLVLTSSGSEKILIFMVACTHRLPSNSFLRCWCGFSRQNLSAYLTAHAWEL